MSGFTLEREFGSLLEFVEFASDSSPVEGYRASRDNGKHFTGTDSWDHAVTLAHGWTEGAKRIEQIAARINPKGQKSRRVAVMREVGPGSISMGNYLSGHPQPYVTLQETNAAKPGKGKVVRLAVNVSASAMVDTKVIERRGATVVALAHALERAGRRVEIDLVYRVNSGLVGPKTDVEYRVVLKAAHNKLNLPSLAFALAHPSMLRRIVFSALEVEVGQNGVTGVGSGYGFPETFSDTSGIYLDKLHGLEPQWRNETRATAWVVEELRKQGVTLK